MADNNNSRYAGQEYLDAREALQRIYDERRRQDQKWGEQNHPDHIWALILGEEYGELQKAILELEFCPPGPVKEALEAAIDEELTHVTSVGYQWMQARLRKQRRESTPEARQRRAEAGALSNVDALFNDEE